MGIGETGFYYLQSRYYDPVTGRFLNADGHVNANGDLIGYNMYAYCSNNPVMNVDPSGEGVWSDIWDAIVQFFSNTFGVGVVKSNSYENIKPETVLGGIEEGTSTSKTISGDISKPISVFLNCL